MMTFSVCCRRAALLAALPFCFAHAQMQHVFVESGQARIETFSIGRGPLVLIVPSAARGADDYISFATNLSRRGYRVICVNPRNVGSSSDSAAGYTLHDASNDLAAVIRQQQDGPAVLVGHAAGSFSARVLAVDHPELVRGVVLAAAGAKSVPPEVAATVPKLGADNLPDTDRLKLLRFAFFAPGNDASIWLRGWYARHTNGISTIPPAPAPDPPAAPGEDPRNAWWGAGKAPVLELQPLDDAFKPAATRSDYKRLYGDRVTVVTIPHAGHALFPEQPALVESAILNWITTLPPLTSSTPTRDANMR